MLRATLFLVLLAPLAHGFSVGSAVTNPCHERITLRASRAAGVVAASGSVTPDDVALMNALPFPVEGAWDRSTLALLIGARENDFHGAAAVDLAELASVHLSPVLQHEHCLRSPGEDDAEGNPAALARCRAFIVEQLTLAANAAPDETADVRLALTDETVTVSLPAAPLHLGRALHALEDSFAHTLRGDDFHTVRSVFNYVDAVGTDYQPLRDGHRHLPDYDSCVGELPERRADAAVASAAELIRALAATDASPQARVQAAEATLDPVWNYSSACADGAAWCDHAEELLDETLETPRGCSAASGLSLGALGLVVAAALRRRGAVLAAILLVAVPAVGRADEPSVSRLHPSAGLGLSFDRGAGIVALGLRVTVSQRIELFGDVELNPWFDAFGAKATWGAGNVAVGGTLRWVSLGGVELRSSLGAGVSVLLHDTVGARIGSVGPFLEVSVLNALVPGPGATKLELRPEVVISVPSLRGIPLVYHQYRFMLTMRLG